jgi:3,4-dihydroxy 2-butanone 4-phosphate synthase/GTP cyclohydrolase II
MRLSSVESALEAIRSGGIVIVVDDEDRENEGDFVMAAEHCRTEDMSLFIRRGSGYVCVPMFQDRLNALQIPMMVQNNTSRLGTAMTVTVDARNGTTTGVSAHDRALTTRLLASPTARPEDFSRPGHIVPLRAAEGGVLRRAGHTEATVDLCRLAGLQPVGVLAEVMNDDGSMARGEQLQQTADALGMHIISIADLIEYRRHTERLIVRVATTILPTSRYGPWTLHAYESSVDPNPAIALVKGDVAGDEPVLARVHSSCVTGDLLESLRCDCGDQLHVALRTIAEEGRGVLVYLEQEGRGIGLINKIRAYVLQDEGADTIQANEQLGFRPDLRDYGIGAQILCDLGVRNLRFMTNNPAKVAALEGYGLRITEWVPIGVPANPYNARYLRTKQERMGHRFPDSAFAPELGDYPDDETEPAPAP